MTPDDDDKKKFKLEFTYGKNTDNNETVNKLRKDYEFDTKERKISYRLSNHS